MFYPPSIINFKVPIYIIYMDKKKKKKKAIGLNLLRYRITSSSRDDTILASFWRNRSMRLKLASIFYSHSPKTSNNTSTADSQSTQPIRAQGQRHAS